MSQDLATDNNSQPNPVSFWQALGFWLKLGFISFGGPAGQIAIMHEELVVRQALDFRKTLSARAQLLHGVAWTRSAATERFTSAGCCIKHSGGIVAGTLFVSAIVVYLDRAVVGLHRLWRRAVDSWHLLRHQTCGHRNRGAMPRIELAPAR